MKRLAIAFFLILAFFPDSSLYAQRIGDINYGMYDTLFRFEGNPYRFRRIPGVDFEKLRAYNEPKCLKITQVEGLEKIDRALGRNFKLEYTLQYYKDYDYTVETLITLRRGDKLLVHLDEECGEPWIYYPEFRVLSYRGGHESDQAFNVYTGEDAEIPISVSPNKVFLLTGMDSGQDRIYYNIYRWDTAKRDYSLLVSLNDLVRELYNSWERVGDVSYVLNPFWDRNKLYFHTGQNKFVSLTIPWP